MLVTLALGMKVVREPLDYKKVDAARDAMLPVLERHGYHIPGIADLCAIAAVRATSPIVALIPIVEAR